MSEIFTPGPWRADWGDDGQWYIEPLGISGHALRGHRSGCVESANAHLIAAAPELFEALDAIASLWTLPEASNELVSRMINERVMGPAMAALAKARGAE